MMKLHMAMLLDYISRIFDRLETFWEDLVVRRYMGPVMVLVYLSALVVIELKRQGMLPESLQPLIPGSHFAAVHLAFSLLLVFEVIDLIFGLTRSVSRAFGKQLEIFSIILLRNSFKNLTGASEPVTFESLSAHLPHILASAFGALAIILLLVVYYRMLHRTPITDDSDRRMSFIQVKKAVSLALVCVFVAIGIASLANYITHGEFYPFFPVFFTVLIICDIFMVLISLAYSSWFPVVFRNSGFAVATVLLRIAITAPSYFDVALGLAAAVYAMGLTLAYNLFAGIKKKEAEVST